jgi:hypothetical protein
MADAWCLVGGAEVAHIRRSGQRAMHRIVLGVIGEEVLLMYSQTNT